jgi:hypothetical protein
MNLVFLIGERFDALGLYPLKKDSAYGEHVRKLVALRAKIRDIVYKGRCMDQRGLSGMPERVEARIFARQEPPGVAVTVVDRRKERAAWELRIDTNDLSWLTGTVKGRFLHLDGTEREAVLVSQDGKLHTKIEPSAEVYTLRLDGNK